MRKSLLSFFLIWLGGCIFLVLGVTLDQYLHTLIREFYTYATNDNIYFIGKNFYFYPLSYYLCVPLSGSFLFWATFRMGCKWTILKDWLMIVMLFLSSLGSMSSVDAILRLASCTMCDDGTMALHYNSIDYSFLILLSLSVSIIPFLYRLYLVSFILKKNQI